MKSLKKLPAFIKGTTSTILMLICLMAFSLQTRAADYYWVNGSGNWSDYSAHWAISSGGVIFHTTLPTPADNIYFDTNSFTADSQFVYLDSTFAYCNNMDWSGIQYKVRFYGNGGSSSKINLYGSLILSPDIYQFSCGLNLIGSSSNMIINTAGVFIRGNIEFNGTGAWSLAAPISTWSISFNNGNFNSNSHDITTINLTASDGSNPVVEMGNSTIYGQATISIGYNINFNGVDASIVMLPLSGSVTPTITGNDLHFKSIVFQDSYSILRGNVTADSIIFMGQGVIRELNTNYVVVNCNYLEFDSTATLVTSSSLPSSIGYAVFNGITTFSGNNDFDTLVFNNAGYTIAIGGSIEIADSISFISNCSSYTSITGGSIVKASGTVIFEYVQMSGVTATGGAVFVANNSFDLGNNNGWQFNTPVTRNLFWVNGGGNWSDNSHWSLTPGGPGGECPPSQVDNVFFDTQSFSFQNDTVIIDYPEIQVNNLTFQSVTTSPFFYRPGQSNLNFILKVYGSLLSDSYADIFGTIFLVSQNTGNTVQNGPMPVRMEIQGSGTWSLTGDLTAANVYYHYGFFNTNNFNILNSSIYAYSNSNPGLLNLGSSTLNNSSLILTYANPSRILSANANIIFDAGIQGGLALNNNALNDITFLDIGGITGSFSCNELLFGMSHSINSDSVVAHKIELNGSGSIEGNITVDSLIQHTAGTIMEFGKGSALMIGSALEIASTSCDERSVVRSDSTIIINMTSGSVALDFVMLENIHATGGAIFNATNTVDAGGNSGWNISSSASREMYWIGGAGNWSDPNNWATTSGGPGGNCIPTILDNVFFDNNSFANNGAIETIVLDVIPVYMNDFNYTTTYNIPTYLKTFQAIQGSVIRVNGSLNCSEKTAFMSASNVHLITMNFTADDFGNVILSQGTSLVDVNMTFKGSGDYSLSDSIASRSLSFNSGSFYTVGNAVKCDMLKVNSPAANVDFSASVLYTDSLACSLAGPGFNSQDLTVQFYSMLNGANSLIANGQKFKSIFAGENFSSQGGFQCDEALFVRDFSNYPLDADDSLYFKKCDFRKNVTLYGFQNPTTFDSLLLNNDGYTIQVNANGVLKINDELVVNNSPSFPIQMLALWGSNFFLEKPAGLICMDNMILQGVHTVGSAMYYAGANTIDLGNNSGWIYASCNPANTDVWPGDANYDLTVNNFDVLNVGLGYNAAGPVRAGASNSWVAQPASDWAFQFANGANLKNADCNGDGIISNVDTTAISLNYGLTHPLRLSNPGSASLPGPPLYVVATPDTVMEGDTVQVDIFLGTSQIPVDSIYGLAFTLSFDSTLIDTTYMPFDYSSSWMGIQNVDLLTFEKKFLSQGMVDIAITRTDLFNMAGSGIVLTTGVVIIDNIGARLSSAPPFVNLPITISNVRAVTASEYYFSLSFQGDNVEIDTLGTTGINDVFTINDRFMVFPNPAREVLHINSGGAEIQQLELSDKMGSVRRVSYPNSAKATIDTRSLSAGVYLLKATTSNGVVVKKVIITNK